MTTIEYMSNTRRLNGLLADRSANAITLPPHQRGYVWTLRQQEKLVDSVSRGMPMPSILLRSIRTSSGTTTISLEDGQQRLTTLERFVQDKFPRSDGKFFKELTELERAKYNDYNVPVLTYSHATDSEAIEIFNNLQNGTPLTVGERILSQVALVPIIKFTIEQLLTPNSGFYNRTLPFWGPRSAKAQRGRNTAFALAIVAGLAFGSKYISKKWPDIEDILAMPFNPDTVLPHLTAIVEFYEGVHLANPVPEKARKTYWDPGTFTGYMAHAIKLDNTILRELSEVGGTLPTVPTRRIMFSKFRELLNEYSHRPEVLKEGLHMDINVARSWTPERWHNGWRRLFDPDSFDTRPAAATEDDEEM